ncbi:MAG: hypothetical protein L7H10_02040 [Vulcanisaeta sp.]|jgi:7-cyano-7-deazaguanine reductase|nr:hypothetical protein [Vulcanisaeta sp.]MCG2869512.1 hypothetical protein [Vulcanisaeta sp.]MCG2886760.1 hypothetical protein [Vulcanisaeta sp.]
MIRAVIARPVDRVELEAEFTAICPVDNTVDNYLIRIMYKPRCDNDRCMYLELGSFREFLDSFKNRAVYHEDLINEVMDEIVRSINPAELSITLVSNYRGIRYVIERNLNNKASNADPNPNPL